MIIHKKEKYSRKYVQGRGFIFNKHTKYVHGKGIIDSLIPMAINFAKNPESALNVGTAVKDLVTTGINTGKTIKDLTSMANAKKAASEIKNNNVMDLLIGNGFRVI